MSKDRWRRGETIVVQEVWQGRLWSARPLTVVADDGERLALWLPRGTRWQVPVTPPTRPRAATRGERIMRCLELEDWVLEERDWETSCVWLLEAGAAHAVWVSWHENGAHIGWYINLQEPFARTGRGLQTMDLMLDVVAEPDRTWHWKDEDEIQAMVDHGLIDAAKAEAIRAEGERVIAKLEANDRPFNEPWPQWRSEPGWGLPVLPAGWEVVRGSPASEGAAC